MEFVSGFSPPLLFHYFFLSIPESSCDESVSIGGVKGRLIGLAVAFGEETELLSFHRILSQHQGQVFSIGDVLYQCCNHTTRLLQYTTYSHHSASLPCNCGSGYEYIAIYFTGTVLSGVLITSLERLERIHKKKMVCWSKSVYVCVFADQKC